MVHWRKLPWDHSEMPLENQNRIDLKHVDLSLVSSCYLVDG